jgi:hypothetical protein
MNTLEKYACVITAALASAFVGCSSSNSSSSTSGGNAISSPPCQNCLDANCSAQGAACTSSACQTFATCSNPCTNQSCIQSCLAAAHQDPQAQAMVTCFNTSCSSCLTAPTGTSSSSGGSGGSSGASNACPAAAGDQPCDTCLKQQCCSQITACNADSTCVQTAQTCSNSCNDNSCLTSCAQQSGDGPAIALAACAAGPCANCGSAGSSSGASSSGGASSGGSGGGTCNVPPGCLDICAANVQDCVGVAGMTFEHDCPNGPPAGYSCTPTPGIGGVYCCNK